MTRGLWANHRFFEMPMLDAHDASSALLPPDALGAFDITGCVKVKLEALLERARRARERYDGGAPACRK